MEYVRFGEDYEKLEKEGKYTEALDALANEIAYNLVEIHNKYSDNKMEYKKIINIYGLDFGKNRNEEYIEKLDRIHNIYVEFCSILCDDAFKCESVLKKEFKVVKKELKYLIKSIKKEVIYE